MKNKWNHDALSWLFGAMGKSKYLVGTLIGLEAVRSGLSIVYALGLRQVVDAAVDGDASLRLSIGKLCIIILSQICTIACIRRVEESATASLENSLRRRLFSVLLYRDYASVAGVHSGEWMNSLSSDVTRVATSAVSLLPNAVGKVLRLVFALFVLVSQEPRFLYLFLPGGLVLGFGSFFARRIHIRLQKRVQEKNGRISVFFLEVLEGMPTQRAYAIQENTLSSADEKMHAHYQARMKRNDFFNVSRIGINLLVYGVMVCAIWFFAVGIQSGTASYGDFVAMMQLITQVQTPFASLGSISTHFYTMLASAERIMEAEKFEKTIAPLSAEEANAAYKEKFTGIGLSHVGFTYAAPIQNDGEAVEGGNETVVFKDFDFAVKKGEYVALTGTSGAGKSTLLKLMLCLYTQNEGERYICFGEEKEALTTKWQRLFAYVPQVNHLISGTVRESVTFFDKTRAKDEAALQKALKIACADSFVNNLENGADTILGERGAGLSEGQLQRLMIARAVYAERPILLLDECTSALDEETEAAVLQNLRTMTDKTVLIVTHRPAALDICDFEVEFTENGHVVRKLHT